MSDIDIPPDVRLKYLERRQTDFMHCQKSIDEKNFEMLKHIGHQIKGHAITFGYADLEKIAIDLEQSAIQQDIEKLKSIMTRFSNFLAHTH